MHTWVSIWPSGSRAAAAPVWRRAAQAAVAVAVLVSLSAQPASMARAAEPVKPLKALLVLGGCCHDYAVQKDLLAEGIAARAHVEVTIAYSPDKTTKVLNPIYENDDWYVGYDVIIHDECTSDVKDLQVIDRILKPHRNGVPAVLLHCAMHSFRSEGFPNVTPWFEFSGLQSTGHGPQVPINLSFVDRSNPILNGGVDWITGNEELYNNSAGALLDTAKAMVRGTQTYTDKKSGKEVNADCVCVWTNNYRDKAKVFATTLGHNNTTVGDPRYLDMVTRGLLWSCGALNDKYLKPFTPKQTRLNIAPGKKVTASSEESNKNNVAANAVDDNPMTRWCAANSQVNQWIAVDLGKAQEVTGLELLWESQNNAYKYRVEVSSDGNSWTPAIDAASNSQPGLNRHELKDVSGRYVRVTFLGSSAGGWGSIREVKIFGDQWVPVNQQAEARRQEADVLDEVKFPDGFEVTLFAAPPKVLYPTLVAAAPDGTLYVSVDKNGSLGREPNRGSVYRLRDTDGDGRADEVKKFVENVDSPRGLVWDQDRLYLMHPPHLSAYIDHDGDGRADEEKILIKNIAFGFKDRPADHTSNGVTLGIDGWLYLAIGDFGFMDAEGADGTHLQLRGGGVVRVRTDGSGMHLFSRGTRNILEVEVDPLLNAFARDNTNDGGGWDIRLHHFTGLDDHGYPSLFKNFPDECVAPLADYGGGSGCGGLYLAEPGFPKDYGDALLTCDWGRQWVYRERLTPKGATFTAQQEEFIGVPRVTDLDVDASSHLYVASWKGATFNYVGEEVGYVVRVSPKGYKAPPVPDFAKLDAKQLIEQLQSPSHRRQLAAQRALLRKPYTEEIGKALYAIAEDKSKSLPVRVAAIFTLAQPGCIDSKYRDMPSDGEKYLIDLVLSKDKKSGDVSRKVFDDHDRPVMEFLMLALSDTQRYKRPRNDEIVFADILGGLPNRAMWALFEEAKQSKSPKIRLRAAQLPDYLFMRIGDSVFLGDPDPLVSHTAEKVCRWRGALDAIDNSTPSDARRRAALRALSSVDGWRMCPDCVVPGSAGELITRLDAESAPERRADLIAALCRLYFIEGKWTGNSWGTRPDTTGPLFQPEKWEASDKIGAYLEKLLADNRPGDVPVLLREVNRNRIPVKGSVESVVELALKDAGLVPTAVGELSRAAQVPPAGVPLLVKVASDEQADLSLRAQAVVALAKVASAEGLKAQLAALAKIGNSPLRGQRDGQQAISAFSSSKTLDQQIEALVATAAAQQGDTSAWADAGLMIVADNNRASPEARQAAKLALDAGWRDAPRRAQMLRAVQLAGNRAWSEKVLASLADPDKQVAAAAERAAKELRLDTNKKKPPQGPLVVSMDPESAVQMVLKQRGDVAEGEQLFHRLQCVKCHTVRQDETPRGPFLGHIASTYKRRELTESILLPSKSIAQGFATQQFIMDDGRVFTGFVTSEGATEVVIRDLEANETKLPVAQIEERGKQPLSMMPEGLAKELTVGQLASLVDYLESLVKK
ncbi:MAG: discoidin domain-containing protein [Planctomycetes bacterium]|nr:discoidin domain-containing protein [Planctomycetota bacterium]